MPIIQSVSLTVTIRRWWLPGVLVLLAVVLSVAAYASYRQSQGTVPVCAGPLCNVVVPENRAGTDII